MRIMREKLYISSLGDWHQHHILIFSRNINHRDGMKYRGCGLARSRRNEMCGKWQWYFW